MAGDGRGACLGAGAGPAGVGTARGVRGHAMPVGCETLVCHRVAPRQATATACSRPPYEVAAGCWSGGHLLTLVWGAGGAGSWPLGGGRQGRMLGRMCRSCRRGHSTWSAMPVCCEALVCHRVASRQASATSCHTGQGRHMRWLQGVGQAVICSPWCGVLAGPGAGPLGGGRQGRVLGRRCRSCRRGHSTWCS